MESKQGRVNLDLIKIDDTFFKISTGGFSTALAASIKRLGLINPPVLMDRAGSYQIVSGFKRIAACRRLNMNTIPARLLDAAIGVERCIEIAISDNTFQRDLNLVEQAYAVELLSSYHHDTTELLQSANCSGLSINQDMARKLRKLAGMDGLVKSGVLDGAISLPVALQLQAMNNEVDSKALAALFMELGLSLNRQREMLEWILSICRWERIGVTQLLMEDGVQRCRRDMEMDRRQKVQQIRDYIKKRRFPTIVKYERRFAETVRKLDLSNGTHLIPPQHFESPLYSLKVDFKNHPELIEKIEEISMISKSDLLTSLWDDFG